MTAQQPTLWDPAARKTDPTSSHLAAVSVKPANAELVAAIRECVREHGQLTQEQIAARLGGARWLHSTVVTACARAGLVAVGSTMNARGRLVHLYALRLSSSEAVTQITSVEDYPL